MLPLLSILLLGTWPPLADSLSVSPEPEDQAVEVEVRALRNPPPESVNGTRLALVAGGLTAGTIGAYLYQNHLWWADEHRNGFRFHTDGGHSEHIDKLAHGHATYVGAQLVARSLEWSGLAPGPAAAWGSLGAWLMQLNVEIRDGFSEAWGFDVEDLLANTVGAGFFYARERVPALQPLVPKFTYWPSEHLWNDHEGAFGDRPATPLTDYMGQTYWMSLRVHDILPESMRGAWPPWLAVAGGISGDRLYTEESRRAYYLSLDVDLERLIPVDTWLASAGLEVLNTLKLPTPAVRLHPRPAFFLVYYGQN
jgi:hypothetical protein